jgi:hypothetical protein
LINQYVQQLRSSDARIRREAIIALGKSNDPSALAPLAEIYRSDPDPTLRDLALKAGRFLKQQVGQVATPAQAAPSARSMTASESERIRRQVEEYDDNEVVDTPTKPEPPRPKRPVTEHDVQRSKSYIDSALTLSERGESGKAAKLLQQAIEVNPDIVRDNYFQSVASGITNRSGDDAIAFLLDKQQTTSFARQNAREQVQKRKSKHLDESRESSWMGVGLEAFLFFIINSAGIALISLVIFQVMQNALQDPTTLNELQLPRSVRSQLDVFTQVGMGFVFLVAVFYGFGQVVSIFVFGFVVHVAAVFIFQGKGLLRHFLDKLLGFYNKRLLVYYALGLLATFLTFGAGAALIGACLSIIISIFTLYMFFQQVQITAKAYDFGALGGCLSNVTGGVLLLILLVALQVALGASIGTALTNASGIP